MFWLPEKRCSQEVYLPGSGVEKCGFSWYNKSQARKP